jgi:hypothetical protein
MEQGMSEDDIEGFLKTPDRKAFLEWVQAHAEQGDIETLRETALRLERRANEYDPKTFEAKFPQGIFEYILAILALRPGSEFAKAAFELSRSEKLARAVGQWLVSGQEAETLEALFAEYSGVAEYRELLACLLHEMAVRGWCDAARTPCAVRFQAELTAVNHPLAWLPLELAAEECHIATYAPHFDSLGNKSYGSPGCRCQKQDRQKVKDPQVFTGSTTFTDMTVKAEAERIGVAVKNWQEGSNGDIEAGVFSVAPPAAAEELPGDFLYRLGLQCLEGAAEVSRHIAEPSEIANILFAAAANGGAYNKGHAGAYGRLEMWQSLAALAGCGTEATYAEAMKAVRACRGWWTFEAVGSDIWFSQVAWDIGIVVLRPEGNCLAILAATDMD